MSKHADFDLDDAGNLNPTRGGWREGAGRPKGYSPKRAPDIEANADLFGDLDDSDRTTLAVRKARAVTEKEEWTAKKLELSYRVDSREFLARGAFREASATLLAELAQGLRSLPDILERKFNLPPAQVELVAEAIDEALTSVADGLELFTGAEE